MDWRRRLGFAVAVTCVGCLALAADATADAPTVAASLTGVPTANPKAPGLTTPNKLSPQLQEVRRAQGSTALENPDPAVGFYGYDSNGTLMPLPTAPTVEASKTEPDKNTYLVFPHGLKGADPAYDYGTHFVFRATRPAPPASSRASTSTPTRRTA